MTKVAIARPAQFMRARAAASSTCYAHCTTRRRAPSWLPQPSSASAPTRAVAHGSRTAMTQPAITQSDAPVSPESGATSIDPDTRVRASDASLAPRFLEQLAHTSDGIGWVHVLESWQRHGLLARFARSGGSGLELGSLAAQAEANLGYLAVVVRVLAAQGWMWRKFQPTKQMVEHTRAGLTPAGTRLFELVETGAAAAQVVAFTPVARRMAAYLEGTYDPEPGLPSLEQ